MLVAIIIVALVVAVADSDGQAAMARAPARASISSLPRRPPRLVFGIYPGGAAGTVGPSGQPKPEDAAKRLAAIEELRPPGRPFVVHLYASYTGPAGSSAADQAGSEIDQYGSAGLQTELVLCYRPADGGSRADVGGFVAFVQQALQALGRRRGFVSVQVTNEANVGGAPNASDGYYRMAEEALVQGVIAAKAQVRQAHLAHVGVGFNWAYANDAAETTFWRHLGEMGGRRFAESVDWVGLDAYPGTWGPSLPGGKLAAATGRYLTEALGSLRNSYMPLAGIPSAVPLHVSENGYPTGPGRTDAMQVTVLRSAVTAAYRDRGKYNITGYCWFDLRDADSSSSSFQSQYGLMRDDYSPKPAFGAYRALLARLAR
jgi:hypothetical protein